MIRTTAPARVDLAGGTLDIWPVCHLLARPAVTVNCAIDRRARAEVEERDDGVLEIFSEDRDERVTLPVDAITHDRLGLATRLAVHYGPGRGLSIRLRSGVPPQSGLGGSSTLAVALAGALARLRGREVGTDAFLAAVQTVETKLLRVPTGYQDYRPACFGGAMVLTATETGISNEALVDGAAFLARHLLLVDTRMEHESGMNNWEIVRRFLDGRNEVVRGLDRILACAERMRDALRAQDLDDVAQAFDDEWYARRRLAPVVSNARIDALVDAAKGAGARAAKICGAGGGGVLAVLVDDRDDARVPDALKAAGGALLYARPDPRGLTVE